MKKKTRKKINKILVILIFLFGIIYYAYTEGYLDKISYAFTENENIITDGNLNIYYIDVGQADSILITNNKNNVLIDAGNNEDGDLLVKYIKGLGIDDFDMVVGTHAHEDHIGGMDNIIDNFNISNFYMPDALTTTKTFEDVLDALEKKNIKYQVPKINDIYTFGDLKFTVLYTGTYTDDLNNSSIVLRLDYGNTSYLFTGDATTSCEKEMLNNKMLLDVDVLKVGHHGSNTSSSDAFIKAVSPKYAIISVGLNNTYNLPKDAIIKRIEGYGATIYRTDESGTIKLTSDGSSYSFDMIKTNTNGN